MNSESVRADILVEPASCVAFDWGCGLCTCWVGLVFGFVQARVQLVLVIRTAFRGMGEGGQWL